MRELELGVGSECVVVLSRNGVDLHVLGKVVRVGKKLLYVEVGAKTLAFDKKTGCARRGIDYQHGGRKEMRTIEGFLVLGLITMEESALMAARQRALLAIEAAFSAVNSCLCESWLTELAEWVESHCRAVGKARAGGR